MAILTVCVKMETRTLWQLCFALLCLVQLRSAAAFYEGTDVVTLTASNFDSKIKSGGVWLVEVSCRRAGMSDQHHHRDTCPFRGMLSRAVLSCVWTWSSRKDCCIRALQYHSFACIHAAAVWTSQSATAFAVAIQLQPADHNSELNCFLSKQHTRSTSKQRPVVARHTAKPWQLCNCLCLCATAAACMPRTH